MRGFLIPGRFLLSLLEEKNEIDGVTCKSTGKNQPELFLCSKDEEGRH